MRRRTKSDRRLVRKPLVAIEQLEDRSTPAVAFALSGTNLLSFDTASPSITQTTPITGVNGSETLVGIDFRPQNGHLYGLGVNATADTATLYNISIRTGSVTPVGTVGQIAFTTDGATTVDLPDPATVGYGVDFNPSVDRFRVVAGGLNFRVDPNTGAPIDGNNGGVVTAGINPDGAISVGTTNVDSAAYTNNQPQYAITPVTTQYTLDSTSDSLFIQNPPNNGVQTLGQTVTLMGSTLDFSAVNGFDIPEGVNALLSNTPVTAGSAFAVLTVGGGTALYSINLVDAKATLIGPVGNGTTAVQGFSIQNDYGGLAAIALNATADSIVRFNTANPGTSITQPLSVASLVTGETLVGIDFRPATGQLFGLGIDATADTGTLYRIDPQTGAIAIAVAGTGSAISFAGVDFPMASAGYGFDFNPDVDRIRVTTGTGLNFRINPNTGLPAAATPDGAINGSGVTGVSATAYTNAFGNDVAVTATTQYTLNAATDSLHIQSPPNNGTQINPLPITLGGSPLDFSDVNGFDIPAGIRVTTSASPVVSGRAFATLTVGGVDSIYRIDLTTGIAQNLGAAPTKLSALTLADDPSGTISFNSAAFSASENGGTATIGLTRAGSATGAVTVTVNVTGGTAAGLDFVGGPYTVTFADGASSASFDITITDDLIFEGNETINLTIASVDNAAAIGLPNVATLTILENDPQQTFTVNDAVGYGLSGLTLLPFSLSNPAANAANITISGVDVGETLVGIDFRPQNGQLYGLGVNAVTNTATLYAISTGTGLATPVGTIGAIAYVDAGGSPIDLPDPATVNYDIDFNPAVDRLRIVAGSFNGRVDPNTGNPIDGNSGAAGIQPDGAINGGTTTVGGTAYTNAFPNNGGVTTQYTLDATTNSLFIQNPPNNGTQASGLPITIGGAPIDFSSVHGFDILANVNAPGSNLPVTAGTGLALLTVASSSPTLFQIDLTTGEATSLGQVRGIPIGLTSVAFQSDLGATPYIALDSTGSKLVRSLSNNAANPFIVSISGIVAGETLVGIDFRPQTGQLFGLGIDDAKDTGTIYRIDPQTGAAVAIAPSAVAYVDAIGGTVEFDDPATTGYGFDFNPTVDRIRITNSEGLNARVNPNDGLPVDGDTVFVGVQPDGAINGSGATGISATAYTNAFGQLSKTGPTTQYTLDGDTDTLYIQNPPNAGTQANPLPITLGGNPLDFTEVNGFNIPSNVRVATSNSPVTSGTAFAALTVGGVSNLYAINLATGEATLLGASPIGLGGLATANTPVGIVSLDSSTISVSESGTSATLSLSRTGGTTGEVSVTVLLTAGTASAGTDFDDTSITVTFADGQTAATVNVPIVSDALFETDETFTASLGFPTNGVVFGASSSATVTITNDDAPPVFSIDSVAGPEGNLTFTVTLTGATDVTATVTVDTMDGTALSSSDYSAIAGLVLTFAPGVTSQTVVVNVGSDATFEADENFTVVLSAPTNATIGTGTGTGTIQNNDAAPIFSINDVAVTEGNSGSTTVSFTVTLAGATDLPATVTVTTADNSATAGTDYTAIAGTTLTFNPGETTMTVSVTVTADATVETDETFFVQLTGATNATIADSLGVGTIVNDDVAPPQNPLLVGTPRAAIGSDGVPPVVRVIDADGNQVSSTALSAAFNGGVRVASGDVDGDGIEDVIVGTGPGGPSLVRVLSGKDGTELFSIAPFEASFTGGVFVSTGDLNGDGKAEIVISPDVGGGPRVRVFDGASLTQIADFFGINDPAFRGGARTAVGDVNGDGFGDLVVAAGRDGGPRVSVIDGATIKTTRSTLFNDFFAFEETLRDGVFIAVGDVNGDGFADIVASGGPSGGPRVVAFDSQTLISSKGATKSSLANFFAGDPDTRTGVRIAVKDIDGDNLADIRTAVGGSDTIRTYLGKNLSPTTTDPQFISMDGLPNFIGGVFVG
jgi:hypothetical protein